jgi:hypothetical protein
MVMDLERTMILFIKSMSHLQLNMVGGVQLERAVKKMIEPGVGGYPKNSDDNPNTRENF